MSRAEEFLQKYRVLEDALEARYADKAHRHSSVVMEFLEEEGSAAFRERLDTVREMRNLLTHSANPDGSYLAEPSQQLLDFLDSVTDAVRIPRKIKDIMTPMPRLLFAQLLNRVAPVLREMDERGFSHVPVLHDGKLYGVLSHGAVCSALARGVTLENATLEDMKAFLPIASHLSERYAFLPEDASTTQARRLFLPKTDREQLRLAAVFVTKSGSAEEAILGMATLWDTISFHK